MPPFFKKAQSDAASMSDSHRKVLHRCRMILIKDLDIQEIIDIMVQEEIFKLELKEYLLSLPNREHRVGIFLDRLETRGDRAFVLFMDILRENYKKLHYVMEESLRTIDELHDSEHREHVAISGEAVRKLLKFNLKRKVDHSHGSESAEDLDLYFDDRDDGHYIDCYTIPMRGKLQKESWIKQTSQPRSASSPVKSEKDDTYMAAMMKGTVFKKIDFDDIPSEVRRPPVQCSAVYVVDDDKSEDTAPNSDDDDADTEQEPPVSAAAKRDTLGAPTEQAPPPPLPPKPGPLQVNPPHSITNKPPSLKARPEKKTDKKKTDTEGKPAKTSKPKSLSDKPRKTKATTRKGSKDDIEPPKGSPPLPPRLPSKLPAVPGEPPAIPPRRSPTDGSPQETEFPVVTGKKETEFPVTPVKPETNGTEADAEEEEEGSTLTSDTQPPPPCVEDEGSSPEDEYECVTDMAGNKTVLSHIAIDENIDMEITIDSKSDGGLDDDSRESTPADPDTKSTQDESSKASADSMEGMDKRSVTTDSGVEATTPLPKPPQPTRKETRGPMGLPDVQILPVDISSDSDSYYEDIDVIDEAKKNSGNGATASSPSRTSLMYLDPRSYAKSFDKLASVQELYKRTSIKRKPEPNWEGMGKFKLQEGALVIAEEEVVVSKEVADAFRARNKDSSSSTNISDKTVVKTQDEPTPKPTATSSPLSKTTTTTTSAQKTAFPTSYQKTTFPSTKITTLTTTTTSTTTPTKTTTATTTSSSKTPTLQLRKSSTTEVSQGDDTEATGSLFGDADPLAKFVDTIMVYDKVGRVFYIPKELLQKYGTPEGQPWFYPIEISSRQATLFLSGEKQEGCFLVYTPINRSSGALYNLSVCRRNGDVVHYHIVENIHGDVMIEGHDHSFLNIQDLVAYFRRNKSQLATRLGRPLKEANLQLTPGYHYDIKWEVNRSHLTLTGKIVGKGNFGVVCAGMYHNIPVAIKVLQKVDASIQEEDEFIEEAKTMMKLWHDNVVRLVGVSCVARPFFLISEYVPKGNLRDCLQNDSIPKDNIDTLFDICIQTASAMNYLESRHYILHRDLAARNFLVTEDMSVKLGDFGRARYVDDDHYQAPKNEKVSIKWAAPEILIESSYSTKSDVWALGIVFWEIFSGGERPYEGLSGEQTAIYVTEGGRLDKPPGCAPDLFNMMKSCWRDNADDRPSFAVLYDKLKSKSSIYYSRGEPLRSGPRVPRARVSEDVPLPRSTSSSSRQSRGSGGEKDGQKEYALQLPARNKPVTPTMKQPPHRRTASDVRDDAYSTQQLGHIKEESNNRPGALTNSSSETSLTSAAGILDRDELGRGNKIRKSLRKIMHMKPRRKTNRMDGLQEWQGSSGSTYGQEYAPC